MIIQKSDLIKNTAPYVFAEVDKMVAVLKEKNVDVIDFGVGDPTSPTPDFITQACFQGLKNHLTTGYPSYAGMKEFRQASANYMKRTYGVSLDPEKEITSTIGSKEAILHFPFAFINPGDIVICPSPGYPSMYNGTKYAHGIPYFVGLFEENDFLMDYESIPEDIAKKAVIMWFNYPNSPTGKMAPLSYYEGLIKWAKKYNIILASDEGCYIDIYYENKTHSILELEKEGIIAFYSLSKRNNMTGYRVGFACGDPEIVMNFRAIKTNLDSGTPNFVQEAAIAALNDDLHVEQMRKEYAEKRKILTETLRSIGLQVNVPEATFYFWQKAPNGMTGLEFTKKLLDENIGIVVTPGAWLSNTDSIFGRNPGENYVRFALIPPIDRVKEACERMKKHLKF